MPRLVIVKSGIIHSIDVTGSVRLTLLTTIHSQKPDRVIVQNGMSEIVYCLDGRLMETTQQGTL